MANDGWASDYLRQLNTQGPGNPGNVVSSKVQYVPPVSRGGQGSDWADTSDIQLAPGQNPEGSVYSNASGARMGQTKPASGYRAPAGGGWDVNSSDTNLRFSNESGGKQYRVSRTQTAKKTAKKTVKKQAQPEPEYRTGGARTPEENEIARAAAEHRAGVDLGELSSQALDAAARFLPALKLLGFGVGAGSADTESSSLEGQFKNMPWYEDAKAHHEAVKKNMDDYGSALGTLKSTWDDIPWWTKLVMLPPVFKAGSPAAGASTTGTVWAEGGRAAAGDAAAGAKAFEESLSRMNGGAVRGAPVEGTARRSFSSAAEGRRLYGPVAERLLAPKGPLTGGARTTLTSADEGLPVGYSILRSPKIDTSPLAGQTSSLVEQLRAAGIPEDQIAASIARINAGAAGREAAAAGAGRAGEAAAGSRSFRFDLSPEEAARARASHEAFVREAAAGRGSAGNGAAADGGVSELANAGNAGRGKVALTEQTAKQGLGDVRAAVKSSNIAYEDVMQSVADFAAGKSGNSLAIDIAQSYGQLYRSGFGNILSPRELAIAKAYEHATEGHMQGKFTDGMSQFVDGVLSGVPK